MIAASENHSASLDLHPVAQNNQAGRWRTEAMRSHASARLFVVAKGQGRITVAGLTSGYGPNNLVFIPPHTMYGFEVGPTVFGQMLVLPAAMGAEWPSVPVHLRLRDVTAQKELGQLLDGLERELKAARSGHVRAAHYQAGLLSVFFERQRAAVTADPDTARRQTASARVVSAFTDLIEKNYRASWAVNDYAKALGITPTHLTRCCKQTCSLSALTLLNDRILYEARVMLRDTKQPVQDIAEELGFHSAAYFSRAFQARQGTSPSAFRKNVIVAAR